MLSSRLINYLDSNHVVYSVVRHPAAYSAADLSWVTRTSSREVAKTVIVKIDGDLAMAVVPASREVDLELLELELQAYRVRLASEPQIRRAFPDCETGAMPPFGNLYNLKVYVDAALTHDEHFLFAAGSHEEAIQLSYADYERLVRPTVLHFSKSRRASKAHMRDVCTGSIRHSATGCT